MPPTVHCGRESNRHRGCWLRIRRETFYLVSDGIHRTIAHLERGLRIEARIEGHYTINLGAFVLYREHLWRKDPADIDRLSMVTSFIDDHDRGKALSDMLAAIGVEFYVPSAGRRQSISAFA